jgi:capsular polysaccharide transport system permease protein
MGAGMATDVTSRSPWQIQKSVVFALFLRELKTRFGSYKFGYVWLLLEPMAHVIVLSLMFSYIRDRSLFGIDFPVFIVTGIVPFLMFKNIALRVMDGVEANRALFGYRQIKPMDTFIARTLLDAFLGVTVAALILLGMAWIGLDVPFRDPFALIFLMAVLVLMGLGLGMVLCVFTHYLPEAKTLVRIAFLPLYLLSGIIFPIAAVPHEYLPLLLWNPLLHAIELMRGAFFDSYRVLPDISLLFVVMTTLILLFLGLAWYRNQRHELLAR